MYVNIETLEPASYRDITLLHPETSFPPEIDHETLASLGFAVLERDPEPAGAVPGDIRVEGGRYIQSWIVAPAPQPEPTDWAPVIAHRRYAAEISGTTLAGMPLDTGRDSQALITGAALAAMLDPGYTVRWKTAAGFVELEAAQIIAVAQAVRAHVQACFDREAELLAALEADTFTPDMLEEGWPHGPVPAPAEG